MDPARLVGDYILGSRIGSGSFAVVWRARHRHLGSDFAVKEIDRKLLSPKVSDNLLKEISILSTIDHPNIIQLYETIQTDDRIYLVLEYCDGGDLAGYIHRHGKVSESVARHFMRQLAAGLQVLQEKHLIHRDLKPQNLLLSTNEVTPLLKIGDFGFARSLTPDDFADTLCGSPLYMAPEIIQNQKYDAKADLWSVGTILFQLVTGKPPFDGNNHIQLFQNILRCTELQFPRGALEETHPDCVGLCRSLLRRNPVERLTFREFFNHKFLWEPRQTLDLNVKQSDSSAYEKGCFMHSGHPLNSSHTISASTFTNTNKRAELQRKDHECSSSGTSSHTVMPNVSVDKTKKYEEGPCSSNQPGVLDSMEFIEREYVLVNPHSASMETSSYYLDTSLQDTRPSSCPPKRKDKGLVISGEKQKVAPSCSSDAECPPTHGSGSQATSSEAYVLREVQKLTVIHPPTRLKLLHQYLQVLAEVALDKYTAGQVRESFSIELVILAVWTKAINICDSWLNSSEECLSPGNGLDREPIINQGATSTGSYPEDSIDFRSPSSSKSWVSQEFVVAYNRAEKLSNHLKETDAATQMPDAMEIIYQRALTFGKNGGVDEYMNNKASAATLYSRAIFLLSFIVEEALTLPLSPPFSLTPDDRKRIQSYITNLQFRRSHL